MRDRTVYRLPGRDVLHLYRDDVSLASQAALTEEPFIESDGRLCGNCVRRYSREQKITGAR